MKKYIISIIILVVLAISYWLVSPLWRNKVGIDNSPVVTSDTINNVPKVVSVGKGKLIPSEHEVEGTVEVFRQKDSTIDRLTLHFRDLKVTNGPDLRIYLSSSLDIKDAVDLGPIKANIGNVNYDIPSGTDIKKYKNVLIWCRAFGVLFSYAVV